MGTVHVLQTETCRPMSSALTAEKIKTARSDAAMAQSLKLWAQTAELIALRGELSPPQRLKLLEALSIVLDHPRVT